MKNKITLNEFYKRSVAKSIKTMRGHDGPSQEWNIYFDNKKICNCWDDSYGGELKVFNYENQSIEDIWSTVEKESTYDTAWEMYIDMRLALHEVKSRTLFNKDEKRGVLIGFNKQNYDIIAYNSSILDMLRKSSEYKKEYEKVYMEENDMSGDRKVINWEYLESCDIKVPEEYRWNKQEYISRVRG